jgi:predicted Zn-dependent protease
MDPMMWIAMLAAGLAFAQPAERDMAVERMLAAEIARQTTPLRDDAVSSYVERLGAALARAMDAESVQWRFELIREDWGGSKREPVALPGGRIIVPAGLFTAVEDDRQFAQMLAHSMAHVAQRHGWWRAPGGSMPVFSGEWVRLKPGIEDTPAVPLRMREQQQKWESEAAEVAARAVASLDLNARDGEFAGIQSRVRELAPVPARKTPSLRR